MAESRIRNRIHGPYRHWVSGLAVEVGLIVAFLVVCGISALLGSAVVR